MRVRVCKHTHIHNSPMQLHFRHTSYFHYFHQSFDPHKVQSEIILHYIKIFHTLDQTLVFKGMHYKDKFHWF